MGAVQKVYESSLKIRTGAKQMIEIIFLYVGLCVFVALNAHTEHIDGFFNKLFGRLWIAGVWPYAVFILLKYAWHNKDE